MNDNVLLGLPHWAVVVLQRLDRANEKLDHIGDIENALNAARGRLEAIMAAVDDLNAKVDALVQSVVDMKARIQEDFDALTAQVAAGNPDLGPALAKLQATIDSVNAVDPDPTNPPQSA